MTVDTRVVKGNKTDDKIIKVVLPRKKGTLCLEPEVPTELSGASGLVRSRHYVYDNYTEDDVRTKHKEMKEKVKKVLTFIRVPKENEAAVKAVINGKPDTEVELADEAKAKKFKHHDKKMERINEAIANADNEATGEGDHA